MSVPAPREPWEEDLVLVGGYGRTGTTLMQGLLCASEDVIGMTAEAKLLFGLIDTYARGVIVWKGQTSDYFPDRDAYRHFMRGVVGSYLHYLRVRSGADRRLLQKVPIVARFVPEAADLLPNARFVIMVRDPRAALASRLEVDRRHGDRPNPEGEIERFVRIYAKLVRQLVSLGDKLIFVRYEHLVTDPDAAIERVSQFLGIRAPPNVRSLAWESKRTRTAAGSSPLDGQPVSTASLTKYRQSLDPAVLARLEGQRHEIERRIGMPVFYDGDDPRQTLAAAAAARRANGDA